MSKPWIADYKLTNSTILDLLQRLTKLPFEEYTRVYNAESASYTAYCKLYNTMLAFPLPSGLNSDTSTISYINREIRLNYPELYI